MSETYLKSLKHQKGHPPREKLKEITETKLYKMVALQGDSWGPEHPLSQYYLVFLAFVNFMSKNNRQRRSELILLGIIVA